ncbi:hypothetical protein HY024_00985 [Candidatus Curtissbacteria bacterium]|nr:hypothetical protein [Candidatus Curtissbacteria bacterium]
MTTNQDYQSLLSDLVKKQMVMLGPGVAISKARQVGALTVTEAGDVTAISGDAQAALKELANQYMSLSGDIAQTTLTSLLEKYPEIKAQNG